MAFYDGLGRKIQRTGQDAVEKTRGAAETVKLSAAISGLENEISAAYTEIGKIYYGKYAQNLQDQDMMPYFQRIAEKTMQIEAYRDKIRAFKGLSKCVNCGQEIEANAMYCNCCGAQQPLKPQPVPAGGAGGFCPNCGRAIDGVQLYCVGCGFRVREAAPVMPERRFCIGCGSELEPDAIFCTNCGTRNEITQDSAPNPMHDMNADITADMYSNTGYGQEPQQYSDPAYGQETDPSYSQEQQYTDPSYSQEQQYTDPSYSQEQQYSDPTYGQESQQYSDPGYGQEQQYADSSYSQEPQQYTDPEYEQTQQQYTDPAYGQEPQQYAEQTYDETPQQDSEQASVEMPQLEPVTFFCVNCGAPMNADDVFCTNCGHRVDGI